MNLNEILESIKNWNDLRNPQGASLISNYFFEGNSFLYDPTNLNVTKNDLVHVYFGINEETIKVFIIPSDKDTPQQSASAEGIFPYITVKSLEKSILDSENVGGEIPAQEAISRIENWENNYSTWLEAQSMTQDNIFQAFAIPSSDTANDHHLRIYLGLKENPTGGADLADLVVFDSLANGKLKATARYFDMARPVPPFSAHGALKESNFYLLELAN